MKWIQFRIKTVTTAEDLIISGLWDLGFEGAQIEDKIPLTAKDKEDMYIDIMPEILEDDGIAFLNFFVEDTGNVPVDSILEQVREELQNIAVFTDIGEGTIAVSETEDVDWINNWKEHFHQFYIDDLLVVPSWETVKIEDKDKKILHIDPGTAFGTGMHPTTKLCIEQIKKYVTPQTKFLDVGCGSGILGIIALMYGAAKGKGTDLDVCAIEASNENMRVNNIPAEQFEVMIGNVITETKMQDKVGYECYDMVVANILANIIVPLTAVITKQLKPGGIYITSGIIDNKEAIVKAAMAEAGLAIVEVTYQGEWVSITARKG